MADFLHLLHDVWTWLDPGIRARFNPVWSLHALSAISTIIPVGPFDTVWPFCSLGAILLDAVGPILRAFAAHRAIIAILAVSVAEIIAIAALRAIFRTAVYPGVQPGCLRARLTTPILRSGTLLAIVTPIIVSEAPRIVLNPIAIALMTLLTVPISTVAIQASIRLITVSTGAVLAKSITWPAITLPRLLILPFQDRAFNRL